MSKLSPARRAAARAVHLADTEGAYVRDLFAEGSLTRGLDARDRAFALRLALGATATRGCVDELLDRYLAKPAKVSARVRCALRISAFELVYLGTAPEVAVSQGVELVRACAKSAAGLANAVLRRVADAGPGYLAAADADEAGRPVISLARRAGYPVWLMREIVRSVGEDAAFRIAGSALDAATVAVHVNPRVADEESAAWGDPSVLPGARERVQVGPLVAAGAFDRADAVASDLHAQAIACAAIRSGATLEIGSGRGTKTFLMAAQGERLGLSRAHVALDLYRRKAELNRGRLHAAGLDAGVTFAVGDGCDLDTALAQVDAEAGSRALFDTVFIDAPCSGTGTMRRHPEIPWRLAPDDVEDSLPGLQLELLLAAAARVKAGGELIYATCSVLSRENAGVIDRFLSSDAGARFEVAPLHGADAYRDPRFAGALDLLVPFEDARGCFQTLPVEDGYDGHFCCRMICRG